jgi:hypothetical protein
VLNDPVLFIVMQREIHWMMSKKAKIEFIYRLEISLSFRWHVDKLEFKANNQPNRYPFYDRSFRRVPTPHEQELIDYKKELEARKARDSLTLSSTLAPV